MSVRKSRKSRKIRVGSRDSVLAVNQTKLVIDAVVRFHPELDVELVTMKTTGDLNLSSFDEINKDPLGAKGLFVNELERALTDGRIDLAVHSLKDMSARSVRPDNGDALSVLAFFKRGDPRDAMVLPLGNSTAGDGCIGCSSARRRVQLEKLIPGCSVRPIRGNILTRLRKLEEGQNYSSLVLAAAGLTRLNLESRINKIFSFEEIMPAAGQGILACQGRRDCDYGFLGAVNDPDSEDCAKSEMAFVERLGGGCFLPVAAYAEAHGTELHLMGFYADEPNGIYRKDSISGNREDAVKLGEALAERLR